MGSRPRSENQAVSHHIRRRLEEMEREVGRIAIQVMKVQFAHFGAPARWQPPINAYRCDSHLVICAELAGVSDDSVRVLVEARRLIIRGHRSAPEPDCETMVTMQVLALEIDHGPFERVLELPVDVAVDQVTAERRDGWLWIQLPVVTGD